MKLRCRSWQRSLHAPNGSYSFCLLHICNSQLRFQFQTLSNQRNLSFRSLLPYKLGKQVYPTFGRPSGSLFSLVDPCRFPQAKPYPFPSLVPHRHNNIEQSQNALLPLLRPVVTNERELHSLRNKNISRWSMIFDSYPGCIFTAFSLLKCKGAVPPLESQLSIPDFQMPIFFSAVQKNYGFLPCR